MADAEEGSSNTEDKEVTKVISVSNVEDLNWVIENQELLKKHGFMIDAGMFKQGLINNPQPSTNSSSTKQRTPPSKSKASTHDDVYVEILEQPQQRGLRFRYECESRFGGSIHGEKSVPTKKTFPTIKIHNYVGTAVIVVSCVTKDTPYKPHPHNLVGKNCRRGVCTIKVTDSNVISFPHLSIQCAKKKDIIDNLKQRQDINVDPFLKSLNELMICRVSKSSGSAKGGDEIFLLCEKINREDIDVRFYEVAKGGVVEWEDYGIFSSYDIHRQFLMEQINQNAASMSTVGDQAQKAGKSPSRRGLRSASRNSTGQQRTRSESQEKDSVVPEKVPVKMKRKASEDLKLAGKGQSPKKVDSKDSGIDIEDPMVGDLKIIETPETSASVKLPRLGAKQTQTVNEKVNDRKEFMDQNALQKQLLDQTKIARNLKSKAKNTRNMKSALLSNTQTFDITGHELPNHSAEKRKLDDRDVSKKVSVEMSSGATHQTFPSQRNGNILVPVVNYAVSATTGNVIRHRDMKLEELTSLLTQNLLTLIEEINPIIVLYCLIIHHPEVAEYWLSLQKLKSRKQRAVRFLLDLVINHKEWIPAFWDVIATDYNHCYESILSKEVPPSLHLEEQQMCIDCSRKAFNEFINNCSYIPEELLIQLLQREVLEADDVLLLNNCSNEKEKIQLLRKQIEMDKIPWIKFIESVCPLPDKEADRLKRIIDKMDFLPCTNCGRAYSIMKCLCKNENGNVSQGNSIMWKESSIMEEEVVKDVQKKAKNQILLSKEKGNNGKTSPEKKKEVEESTANEKSLKSKEFEKLSTKSSKTPRKIKGGKNSNARHKSNDSDTSQSVGECDSTTEIASKQKTEKEGIELKRNSAGVNSDSTPEIISKDLAEKEEKGLKRNSVGKSKVNVPIGLAIGNTRENPEVSNEKESVDTSSGVVELQTTNKVRMDTNNKIQTGATEISMDDQTTVTNEKGVNIDDKKKAVKDNEVASEENKSITDKVIEISGKNKNTTEEEKHKENATTDNEESVVAEAVLSLSNEMETGSEKDLTELEKSIAEKQETGKTTGGTKAQLEMESAVEIQINRDSETQLTRNDITTSEKENLSSNETMEMDTNFSGNGTKTKEKEKSTINDKMESKMDDNESGTEDKTEEDIGAESPGSDIVIKEEKLSPNYSEKLLNTNKKLECSERNEVKMEVDVEFSSKNETAVEKGKASRTDDTVCTNLSEKTSFDDLNREQLYSWVNRVCWTLSWHLMLAMSG
ncbi:hypothetical protein KUTeg_008795 [Tegillarca granosa]|uniref:RHD domain-containing protein n=1 Tax=Tegillarca granosa TaxID=220873 RepID=A0ABQ9FA31_TEGGR|nr:hypothetical protein KUTeg_008795 [Tegillarca granosa]